MIILYLIFFVSMLAGSTSVSAADTEPTVFKVSADSDFARFRAPLVEYLRSRRITHEVKVCILGEQASDGSKWAWVIWPGGKVDLVAIPWARNRFNGCLAASLLSGLRFLGRTARHLLDVAV